MRIVGRLMRCCRGGDCRGAANGELITAFGVAVVAPGVGPFVSQGAVESLHLVGPRSVGSSSSIFDLTYASRASCLTSTPTPSCRPISTTWIRCYLASQTRSSIPKFSAGPLVRGTASRPAQTAADADTTVWTDLFAGDYLGTLYTETAIHTGLSAALNARRLLDADSNRTVRLAKIH
jgi:hypothetical protein